MTELRGDEPGEIPGKRAAAHGTGCINSETDCAWWDTARPGGPLELVHWLVVQVKPEQAEG